MRQWTIRSYSAFRAISAASAAVLLILSASSGSGTQAAEDSAARGETISFARQVAPIFIQNCLQCHGEEKAKGGFRIDQFDRLLLPGDSNLRPIVPGDAESSELLHRLLTKDPDDRMPQKSDPLDQQLIAVIERWIDQGALFDGPDPKASIQLLAPRKPHPDPPAVYVRPVPVTALAFRPDGAELAVGGYHEIMLWDPSTGTLARRIKDLPERIHGLAYAPDGRFLACAGGAPGKSGELTIVDAVEGKVERVLGTFGDLLLTLSFSPDGRRLAAGGTDNAIRVYDWASGREELLIQQHADWVTALAFNPDGTLLASASRDRTARVYNALDGALETTFTDHNAPVSAIAFGSDGKQVFSGGRDHRIYAWNSIDGKKIAEVARAGAEIMRIVATKDGIISCAADREVRFHAAQDRKLIRQFSGHADWVYALALHEQSQRLASAGHDGEVRVWQLEDGQLLLKFPAVP